MNKHIQDTLTAGDGMYNEEALKKIVAEESSALQLLIDL